MKTFIKDKIIVRFKDNGIITKEEKYKSLLAVSRELDIEYFALRAVYLRNKKETKNQTYVKSLCELMDIIDNPEYFKIKLPKQNEQPIVEVPLGV